MKLAASLVLLAALDGVGAFGPSPPLAQRQRSRQQRRPATALGVVPVDPVAADAAVTAADAAATAASAGGTDALLGLMVAAGLLAATKPDVEEEAAAAAKPEAAAAKEPEPAPALAVEATPGPAIETTPAQRSFFSMGKAAAPEAPKAKAKAKAKAAPEKPKPKPKPAPPSESILKSAEKAKAEVRKVGVQETKAKMETKAAPAAPPEPESESESEPAVAVASTEVEEAPTKKPGAKRRFLKGVSLIAAAGLVAAARNVVKAYLGRGML